MVVSSVFSNGIWSGWIFLLKMSDNVLAISILREFHAVQLHANLITNPFMLLTLGN